MKLQISSPTMTGFVEVDTELVITNSAMIWKIFWKQPLSNLTNWLKGFGEGEVKIFWLKDNGKVIPVKSRSELRRFTHASKT